MQPFNKHFNDISNKNQRVYFATSISCHLYKIKVATKQRFEIFKKFVKLMVFQSHLT